MNLDNIKILEWLTNQEKENLSLLVQEKKLDKWENLFFEWDEANSMYLLLEWELEVYVSRAWEKIVLWSIKAEEIIWEMAVFWDDKKRMASCVAVVPSRLLVILDFSIKQIAEKHPSLIEKIKNIIKKRESINKSKINM